MVHLLKKIDNTGSVKRCSGSGRPRAVRTVDNVDAVADLVQSQEDKPQTHRSVRQISRELSIPRSCVHDVIKQDLKLKCLKKKGAQELTHANKLARRDRSSQLLRKYPQHATDFIWFSDEKLFTIATPSNKQNDRVYVQSAVKKKEVAGGQVVAYQTNVQ